MEVIMGLGTKATQKSTFFKIDVSLQGCRSQGKSSGK